MTAAAHAYPIDDIVIERHVPSDLFDLQEQYRTLHPILNSPYRRCYKSAESVMWDNDIMSIGVEIQKRFDLYRQLRRFANVDFDFFKKTFDDASTEMSRLLPAGSLKASEVSIQDECLSNFYEYGGKRIFFNLFFEEKAVVYQLSIRDDSGFCSAEGNLGNILNFLLHKTNEQA